MGGAENGQFNWRERSQMRKAQGLALAHAEWMSIAEGKVLFEEHNTTP